MIMAGCIPEHSVIHEQYVIKLGAGEWSLVRVYRKSRQKAPHL